MKSPWITALAVLLSPLSMHAAQSMYCPENHAYINVGMVQDQILAACGQPTVKRDSNNPVMQQIPVTQLIYSTLNRGAMYQGLTPIYNMWSLPSGSTGTSLQVDIINNKVSGIKINSSATNAMTICGGVNIQVGDDGNAVYSACGTPSLVNSTYINKPVPKSAKPEVWIYQTNPYQPPFSLTFVNGILQSID